MRNAQGQFTKPDYLTGDYEELQHAVWLEENSDEARAAADERGIKRRETAEEREVQLLESAKDLREFRQAREGGRIEKAPELSEEMTLAEFSRARRG